MEQQVNTAPVSNTTPLMQQYLQVKTRYPEEILFFRLGDFYEMFFDDAVKAAPILEVVLTKRQTVPMCGIPYHAATGYMAKLLKAGLSVAIAEQLEDPKKTKGMVKRDVVRVVTPGTILDEELLQPKAHNFLVAVALNPKPKSAQTHWALAAVDVSTGQQYVGESEDDMNGTILKSQLSAFNPSEILLVGEAQQFSERWATKAFVRFEPVPAEATDLLSQVSLTVENFLSRDHAAQAPHLKPAQNLPLASSGILFLDETAVRHLELVESSDPQKMSPTLFSLIDRCKTPLGSRQLRWWLLHPSTQKSVIDGRLSLVDALVSDSLQREALQTTLREVADIERIHVRVQTGTVSPRDMGALRHSLQTMPKLIELLQQFTSSLVFEKFQKGLQVPESLLNLLCQTLSDEPPTKLDAGGVIKTGVNAELDELRQLRRSGKKWIADMEAQERQVTGIGSLKVGYNDIFGYFLEVSKTNLSKVPSTWIRKQTMANAERYITPALKEQEEKILGAEEKILALEQQLYRELVAAVAAYTTAISTIAACVGECDAVASLAEVALEQNFVRPIISEHDELEVKGGRHPVIEKQMGRDRFVPNHIHLGGKSDRLLIITGPNMAGKSTYLRQTALIVILAQMGSFVPAEQAHIGIVDKIFTRIGASDRLSQGQSTFMVEMQEVASLLQHATPKSLLVLDEVGRGTSTYDGISIAWAVVDELMKTGPRTLFATHYFELTQLADQLPGVANAHVTAKEWTHSDGKKQVIFLYQIQSGPADRSYGIHVAEMAGLPDSCIKRAREILRSLESGTHAVAQVEKKDSAHSQLDLFNEHPIITELKSITVEQITPIDALNVLSRLVKKI